jgi:hypothetical protein
MKLSKSLLQAIVVGVTLGTAATSCDLVETITQDDIKQEQPKDDSNVVDNPDSRDNETSNENGTCGGDRCPACGMG